MRKSISKLIVAGLSLALSVTAFAAPKGLTTVTKATDKVPTSAAYSKAVAAPKSGIKNLYKKTTKDSKLVSVQHRAVKPGKTSSVLPQLQSPLKVGASAELYGANIYSADPDFEYGIYSLPTDGASNALELVAECPDLNSIYGACYIDGKYYVNRGVSFFGMIFVSHQIYDGETWEQIAYIPDDDTDITTLALDMAYDPTTGKVYGCFYNEFGDGFTLSTQDMVTFKTTPIAELPFAFNAVACAADGSLYGISVSGALYAINKVDGSITLIGDTGVQPQYMAGGTIDQKTGVFYWTVADDLGGYLYTVDTKTAEANFLAEFENEEEIVGLFVPAPAADDNAPGAVEDFTVTFEGDSRVGEVAFRLPYDTFGGDVLMYNVDYTVMRNGEVIKTGSNGPGTMIKFVDVVPNSGNYVYMVSCSCKGLQGPKTKIELWIGTDAPVVPTGAALTYAGGDFQFTWDPVTEAVHAGYLSGDITYDVTLYKDDEVIAFANGLTECEWSYALDAPEDLTIFYASVMARSEKASSDIAVSNKVILGAISAPFMEEFDNEDSLESFTVIDANGDGLTWSFYGSGRIAVRYNDSEDMDDWLITPAVKLEAGKQYTFVLGIAAASDYFPEMYEVYMGTEATPEGMTDCLVEKTVIDSNETEHVAVKVNPTVSGNYYFGVHGVSEPDEYYLFVDYIGVTEGLSVNAPKACSTMFVSADKMGALQATINYVTPSQTISGEETELTKIEIYRDSELIEEIEAPEAGKKASYVDDTVPASGVYTWTIVPYNAAGKGESAEASAFVGIGIPEPVTDADVVETGDTGEVTISWVAPTQDVEGHYLDPSNVTYYVLSADGEIIAAEIPETSITYQAIDPDESGFAYYQIYAATESGISSATATPIIAIGAAVGLPVAESFDEASLSIPLAADGEGAEWSIIDDETLGIPDADGTNGMLAMVGNYIGDYATVYTGKINLDVDFPVLSYATYCFGTDDSNQLGVLIRDCETGDYYIAAVDDMNAGTAGEWNTQMVDLSPLAGKNIQVLFQGVVQAYRYLLLDNIKISQPADVDMQVIGINAPAKVKTNTEFNVNVTLLNAGAKAAENYTVDLMLNGEVVATVTPEALAPFYTAVVSIPYTFSPVCADDNVFTAKVNIEGDADLTNNVSAEAAVDVVMPKLPVPTELTASLQGESVALNWNEPVLSDLGMQTVTDDFEEYEPFTINDLGDWTLVDEDEGETGGFSGITLPGIANYDPFAWYLINYVELGLNESFVAHSGEQYLITMYNADGSPQRDWLISPALSGNAQTISFFARSYTDSYGLESFEVYYSTTDRDLDSFELLDEVDGVPVEWTEFRYDLPEGAKYFAVVCTSQDVFTLFLDDATYEPADAQELELSLVGYNIYRNGVKINEAPVAETSYIDAEGSKEDVYVVTAVYEQGESAPSNTAQATTTGIESVKATKSNVKVVDRTIVVTGAQGMVSVYTADGKQLYSSEAEAINKVTVVPGVYVVTDGKSTNKVVVK